jgi:hypothetical protein
MSAAICPAGTPGTDLPSGPPRAEPAGSLLLWQGLAGSRR